MRSRKRLLATVAAALGVAVAIGHVMQYGLSLGGSGPAPGVANASTEETPIPVIAEAPPVKRYLPDALPTPPAAALMPQPMMHKVVARAVVPEDSFVVPDTLRQLDLNAFGIPCETSMSATPGAEAHVTVRLRATCRPNERVELRHGALRFAVETSSIGDVELVVPVFSVSAAFDAVFADGEVVTARAVVPAAEAFDRVALQWTGDAAMSIHAFEFGADEDDPGHVYSGKPASGVVRADRTGGNIVTLGAPDTDTPALAEVYSFPRGQVTETGVVRLHVEAEVTPFTCGKEIEAEAVQSGSGDIRAVTIRLAMPDCDAVGDILVLKNILRDLKIASN